MNKILYLFLLFILQSTLLAQSKPAQSDFVLARLKYYGGGDWYNDPSCIPNLLQFMADNSNIVVGNSEAIVEIMDELLHEPSVLLLDEPSTGLDPGARLDLWTYLRELSVTSLLTTHLMEEAERCDRLGILDQGKLVALGTPDELRARIGGDVVTITTADESLAAEAEGMWVDGTVRIEAPNGHALIPRLVERFGDRIDGIALTKPTLEDVFIQATGHRFWSEESAK